MLTDELRAMTGTLARSAHNGPAGVLPEPPSRKKIYVGLAAILGGVAASHSIGTLLVLLCDRAGFPKSEWVHLGLLSVGYTFGGFFTAALAKRAKIRHALFTGLAEANPLTSVAWAVV